MSDDSVRFLLLRNFEQSPGTTRCTIQISVLSERGEKRPRCRMIQLGFFSSETLNSHLAQPCAQSRFQCYLRGEKQQQPRCHMIQLGFFYSETLNSHLAQPCAQSRFQCYLRGEEKNPKCQMIWLGFVTQKLFTVTWHNPAHNPDFSHLRDPPPPSPKTQMLDDSVRLKSPRNFGSLNNKKEKYL